VFENIYTVSTLQCSAHLQCLCKLARRSARQPIALYLFHYTASTPTVIYRHCGLSELRPHHKGHESAITCDSLIVD
jgi:hypothetical protein